MSTDQDDQKNRPAEDVNKGSSTEASPGSDKSSNKQANEERGFIKKICDVFYWRTSVVVLLLGAAAVHLFNFTGQEIDHRELRLMLVGISGAGKSASGNTILSKNAFRVQTSPVAGSQHCLKENRIIQRRNITVIDTPGFLDTWLTLKKTVDYIPECIQDPTFHPHIFLFVIHVGRFTEEERDAVKWFRGIFGEKALKFTLILFTGGDRLNGKPVEDFISNSFELKSFIYKCEGRYHTFNNYDQNNQIQVTELFQKIDQILYENLGYHSQQVV